MASPVQVPAIPHLLELLKIVEGAVNADRGRVTAFTEQLAAKIESEGDQRSAGLLRKVLANSRIRELHPSRLQSGKLPVDSESRLALADEQAVARGEVEMILSPEAQALVDEFLKFINQADKLLQHGVGIAPSMLVYGPPGCGKTELGRYVASQLGLPLVVARTDAIISSYLGSTAKNLRLLFEHSIARPCVLFLDEFDAVAKLRDDKHEVGELKRVVVSLLQNIDALDSKTVLLAATNHEHLLDPAIWRRFAFKVRLDQPDAVARERLFLRFLGTYADEETRQVFATVSEGLTGAEIRQVSEDAKRNAVLSDGTLVAEADVLRRVLRVRAPEVLDSKRAIQDRLKEVRALSPNAFTYRRLAEIFEVSLGHISNLVRKGG